MPRADFYLIDKPQYRENPLLLVCKLVQHAYAAQQPTLILTRDFGQAEALDGALWEFDEDAFIPHQLAGDEDDDATAVLIVPPGQETADRPLVINLRDTVAPGRYQRVLEVVPAETDARDGSRRRWREYQQRGFELHKHDM
jgi:DNA polymerase III subunit chi